MIAAEWNKVKHNTFIFITREIVNSNRVNVKASISKTLVSKIPTSHTHHHENNAPFPSFSAQSSQL